MTIHSILSSQALLDLGCWWTLPRQNTESEKTDFRSLKIDNGFVTNQWQTFHEYLSQWIYPHCWSLPVHPPILLWCRTFSSRWDLWNSWWNFEIVEKFFPMKVAAFIVAAMNIPQIIECSSPGVCNVRHSFLSFSHLIFYFIHKFCCVITHDESFGICYFLGVSTFRLPWSIMKPPFVPYGLRTPVEKNVSMMWPNLLHRIPRSFLRFPWSIVCRNLTFPLLRRLRMVIIQFWITCWWESIRLPWSIIYHNRFPRILIFVPSLHRAWWSWNPRSEIHHKSWFCCDSFFSWFLLSSFRHRSRASCGTEMANVEQAQQMIPLITCEIYFG